MQRYNYSDVQLGVASPIKSEGIDIAELELDLIDHGLEELFPEDDCIVIYAGFKNFGAMQKALEEKKMEVLSTELQRIPVNTVQLTEEQMAEVEAMIEKIEDDEDVQGVYHNMA